MKFDLKIEPDKAIKYLDELIEKKAIIDLTQKLAKRSLSANNLYWLWLTCIEQETGNSKEDLHEYFKNKWIKAESKELFGEFIQIKPSTTSLDTSKFKQYLDKIQVFVNTELEITLPDPEDLKFVEFERHYRKYL